MLLESNVYRPDAGLYHLPYVNILNDEKIIFGLSNFHFRYGHISIIQYLSAISNNFIFKENGIVFASALIASSVIINFSYKIYHYNKNKNYNLHFYYLISVLVFIIYKMNRYSEYGNDAPSHFMFFFLVSELIILDKKNIKKISNCLIIILFIILNKITLLMSAFFALFILKKEKILELLKLKRFYFLIFFALLWFTKNIIVSGCLIFPVKSTCLDSLLWTDINLVIKISNENEAYTKDWPSYSNSDLLKKEISMENYNKDFVWIKYWLKGHFLKIFEILIPYILFLLLLATLLRYNTVQVIKLNEKKNLYLILVLFFSLILWFLKVPVFRYGYSYLICLIALLFSLFCIKNYEYKKSIETKINFLLIFCLTIFISKNILRIINTDNNYNNYPWPKFYAMDEKNISHGINEIFINGKKFYKPKQYCMYSSSVCGHYGADEKLDVIYKKNYYVMYLKKLNN